MAHDINLLAAVANAACDAIVDAIDAGSGAGTCEIYDGSKPAGPATAVTDQVLLAVLTFSDPAFGAASNGVATASAITQDSSANATGTATWFRVKDSDGNAKWDGTVGVGSDYDLNVVTTSIVATQPVQVSSFTVTVPM